MRTTVLPSSPTAPELDVEVPAGVGAGDVRRRLAVLTGDPRWAHPDARVHVDDVELDDTHPAGAVPFLPGARLSREPQAPHPVRAAVRAGRHVAVVHGPGSGTLVALPVGTTVRVGDGRTPGPDGVVEVRATTRTARVRVLAGPGRPRRGRPVAHLVASRRHGRRRRRPVRAGRWYAWHAGADLHVGFSALRLRTGADLPAPTARARRRVPSWALSGLATTTTSVALAVALHQPVLLLGAVLGALALVAARPGPDGPTTAPAPGAPQDVAALRALTALTTSSGTPGAEHDGRPLPRSAPVGDVAVLGDRAHALAAARAVVLHRLAAAPSTTLVVRTHDPRAWAWTRWWSPRPDLPPPDAPGSHLVVVDDPSADLGRWRAARAATHTAVVVGATSPAWVGTVLHVHPAGSRIRDATGLTAALPVELVGADVADAHARDVAAARAAHHSPESTSTGPSPVDGPARTPPTDVALGDLPGVPAPEASAVAAAWSGAPRTLRLPLGRDADGRCVRLDLDAGGPHALAAGTTGAGKSELLTTLVLAAALTQPPDRLALLLVDFKGGTTLGPLAGLPHVVGHVDDLDADGARRTLVGLRAELRRRERALASAGATHLRDLPPGGATALPRLVVVVDELRALVDDVPDAADVLARLAAQGRALGVHLVLATQRPAGAVTADLRANVTTRLCLRVADPADSRDVVEVPDASRIDPAAPGRGVLRVAAGTPTSVQVARARRGSGDRAARLALPWHPGDGPAWRPGPGTGPDDVAAWVAAARAAAGGARPDVTWWPGLPDRVDVADLPAGPGLPLALADLPAEQRRTAVRWDPAGGPLLVLGGPRSGRSTALTTLGTEALRAGMHVHTVGLPVTHVADLTTTLAARLGTVAPVDDPARVARLLDRLQRAGAVRTVPDLVLVDGLDAVLEALSALGRGEGADLLRALWRTRPAGVHLAASAPVAPAVLRVLGEVPHRLVLPSTDPGLDALAGVPRALAGAREAPGRAVACWPAGAAVCHVATRPAAPCQDALSTADRPPVRLGALPARVGPPGTTAGERPGQVRLGVGGDGPTTVHVPGDRTLLVAGTPGSGRTGALRTLAHGWARTGARVVRLAPAAEPGPWVHVEDVADVRGGRGRPVLLVDDADELERVAPGRLEEVVDAALHVAAVATTTAHAATAFRGPVAAAARARHVLVLDAGDAAAHELLGPRAWLHVDPVQRPPGRGVLRLDRVQHAVQVDHHDA